MKAGISIQTVFFVMMGVFMVIIIMFGLDRLSQVNDALSAQEQQEVAEKVKEAMEYCSDPLADGSRRTFEFRHESFNSICYIGDAYDNLAGYPRLVNDLQTIQEGDHNVVLLETEFGMSKDLQQYAVVDTFKANVRIEQSDCFFDFDNTGIAKADLVC